MTEPLVPGLYEALLDERVSEALRLHPELRSVFSKIDPEEEPVHYAAFVWRVLSQALRGISPDSRREMVNRILQEILSRDPEGAVSRLVPAEKPLLLEILPPNRTGSVPLPRPVTPVSRSSLFTGSPSEPRLGDELLREMSSADSVDVLVSFIKWSGLRILLTGFEELARNGVPVRVITTSYMGASDPQAVEWLAGLPNVEIRISYDTERTRLHAKSYHFRRESGFSSAYIGSSNMSHPAMVSGLEWNLKVTERDMPHILEKFRVEFETYWNSKEFVRFRPEEPEVFRAAVRKGRDSGRSSSRVFFDLRPHPFQERILEALERERELHGHFRNLVVAATGTGKTVISAFDFKRFYDKQKRQARFLFVAHRLPILEQARETFRNVLRDPAFGEILGGEYEPDRFDHLFCSVGMISSRKWWEELPRDFYDYIVVDEVHHGPARSYRPVFSHFSPQILLGLTATPERMDGESVAADFGHRIAAEIRLPEALEEKLLCPFQYFGVADPVDLSDDRFWKNGHYDVSGLESVYTGDDLRARQRRDALFAAIDRFLPETEAIRGLGFCVGKKHAQLMARWFSERGIPSEVILSDVGEDLVRERLSGLTSGRFRVLFTVDKLSEGVDLPEVNTVFFLRPTESLTVFLQQLGRGLRHAPGKECLTVLDLVGQVHRRYRMDTKWKALLSGHRFSIDREVEEGFPHVPPGCTILLDRIARDHVLRNVRENLKNLRVVVPERIRSFEAETGKPLTFGDFVTWCDMDPVRLLAEESWSEWKALASGLAAPADPDLAVLKRGLSSLTFINGIREIRHFRQSVETLRLGQVEKALGAAGEYAATVHRRVWRRYAGDQGIPSLRESFARLSRNPSILSDLSEILDWAEKESDASPERLDLPFPCPLELHGRYGNEELQGLLGKSSDDLGEGQRGVGVMFFPKIRTYALLVTFQKGEKEFSPSTMYADYPVSRTLLHWESQSNTRQGSLTGQNLIGHQKRNITILLFARERKKQNGQTLPFVYLGPCDCDHYEGERPIRFLWRLKTPMPALLFENNRRGG